MGSLGAKVSLGSLFSAVCSYVTCSAHGHFLLNRLVILSLWIPRLERQQGGRKLLFLEGLLRVRCYPCLWVPRMRGLRPGTAPKQVSLWLPHPSPTRELVLIFLWDFLLRASPWSPAHLPLAQGGTA